MHGARAHAARWPEAEVAVAHLRCRNGRPAKPTFIPRGPGSAVTHCGRTDRASHAWPGAVKVVKGDRLAGALACGGHTDAAGTLAEAFVPCDSDLPTACRAILAPARSRL